MLYNSKVMNEDKTALIFIILAIFVITGGIIGGLYVLNSNKDSKINNNMDNQNQTVNQSNSSSQVPFPSKTYEKNEGLFTELGKEDVVVGTGKEVKDGDTIVVNYTGKLPDGTMFDSSLNPGREPFEFTIGQGRVIEAWEQGFIGMREGGKRVLNVPTMLGYGPYGAGGVIKPNYDLVFEVELIKINN
jgi:peptidylprolyl isomerase